jgi:hypothetical protein
MIGLAACSPGERKASQAAAHKAAAAQPLGHTPHPVQDIGRADLFHGYRCGTDCSGHQKGYAWAAQHKIAKPEDCRGTSETFVEGCWAYAGKDGPLGVQEIFQDED